MRCKIIVTSAEQIPRSSDSAAPTDRPRSLASEFPVAAVPLPMKTPISPAISSSTFGSQTRALSAERRVNIAPRFLISYHKQPRDDNRGARWLARRRYDGVGKIAKAIQRPIALVVAANPPRRRGDRSRKKTIAACTAKEKKRKKNTTL